MEAIQDVLLAEWVAIFEQVEAGWVCRAVSGDGPKPGETRLMPQPPPANDASGKEAHSGHPRDYTLEADVPMGEGRPPAILLVGARVGGEYGHGDRRLLQSVAADFGLALRKAADLDDLRAQAYIDALTGCYNRRGFDERLQVEIMRGGRYGRPTALMLVDLDGFKRINDELGHQAGDHVLRSFATLLSRTFRNTDVVSRYGGDEFAVIFPETSREDAVQLALRARALLVDLFPDDRIPRPVTGSFGVAAAPGDAAVADELVAMADRALYSAKTGGRDRVVAAEALRQNTDR